MSLLELHTGAEDRLTLFAEVILPLALPGTFTYRVPYDLNEQVRAGQRVSVQFGKKKIYSAIIHHTHQQTPKGYEAKYLISLIDEQPIVSTQQLQLWEWMAEYYMCSIGEVMNAALPAGLKLESESKVLLSNTEPIDYTSLNDKEYLVIEALEKNNQLSISEVSEIVQQKNVLNLLKELMGKQLISITEELRDSFRPKTISCVKLQAAYKDEEKLKLAFDQLARAQKQLDLLMCFVSMSFQKSIISKKELLEQARANDNALKGLLDKNILELYALKEDELKQPVHVNIHFDLNPEQEKAMQALREVYSQKQVALLHGVTGSGKTHIYVKLAEEELQKGRQVLYLLPEIALTSQVIIRLRKYFGDRIVTFHSRMSDREKIENWQKVLSGKALVVLGPRSSLFLPFSKLSLVIVDEEHENSFKQQDPAPRYHARDTAIYLAGTWKAKVLLGSATPSYESFFNARQGKYGLVEMNSRFGEMDMPEIQIADIAEDKKKKNMRAMFGEMLLSETEAAISRHEQVILFQNRRGYAPLLECATCGWNAKCVNCDICLTYHKNEHRLKCHYCGYHEQPVSKCRQCGSTQLVFAGFGTEKIEDELSLLLPHARMLRLDLDATRNKHSHTEILQDFESGKADILIGTQMLSKGLDFEKVSLVGILNADQMLHFPDFRAYEKAFQLITQVSGRAGRKHKRGRVIIQSHHPGHLVLLKILQHDYTGLFETELLQRQQFHYPPYYRLIQLTLRHQDEKLLQRAAQMLGEQLKQKLGRRVIGPESPYVSRIKNRYLQNILIKFEREQISPLRIKQLISELVDELKKDKELRKVDIIPDVDPY